LEDYSSNQPIESFSVSDSSDSSSTWSLNKDGNVRKRINTDLGISSSYSEIGQANILSKNKDKNSQNQSSLPIINGVSQRLGEGLVSLGSELVEKSIRLNDSMSVSKALCENPLWNLSDKIASAIQRVPSTSERLLENADKAADLMDSAQMISSV
jgi:hypothetical protein